MRRLAGHLENIMMHRSRHRGWAVVGLVTVLTLISDRVFAGDPAGPEFIVVESATVRFASQTLVPATRSGRIEAISSASHETVKAGQAILKLDDSALLLAQEAAKLKLNAAERRAKNRVHQQFAELALGEAEDEWEASNIVQQEAQGAIATNQMRRLRMAVQRARLDLAEAREQQVEAKTEADIVAAELATISADIADAIVRSPNAGEVVDLPHRVGEWVEAGETVAVIAEVDRLRVDALISASQLDQNECVGLSVMATWPDPLTGQLRQLGGRIDSSDLQNLPGARYRVHATLDNVLGPDSKSWLLKPGVNVTLRIQTIRQPASRLGSIRHRSSR